MTKHCQTANIYGYSVRILDFTENITHISYNHGFEMETNVQTLGHHRLCVDNDIFYQPSSAPYTLDYHMCVCVWEALAPA